MSFFDLQEAGSLGLKPRTVDVRLHLVNTAQAEAAYTLGQVAVLDRTRTSSETTNSRPGASGTRWANVVTPVTALLQTGTFLFALEAVAKGADGKFRMQGYCQARILNSGLDATAGGLCAPINSEAYLESDTGSQAAGAKLIFELDETSAAADDGTTLRWGWANGE